MMSLLMAIAITVIAGVAHETPIMINTDITISADDNAVVTVSGTTRLVRAVQYCSDEVNNEIGCPKNVVTPLKNNSFQLDIEGLQAKQNVFNLQYEKYNDWLWIPSARVKIGKNLKLIRLGGGAGIQYTGPIPTK